MKISPTSFSPLAKRVSKARPTTFANEARDEDSIRSADKLIKLRAHVFKLMKSTLLVKAVLVSPARAAQTIQDINSELTSHFGGELKSQSTKFRRCCRSNYHSVDDLDAVTQELRTTVCILDEALGNLISEVEDVKTNTEQFKVNVKDVRASVVAVLENERRIEKIITFSRLSSS